jgi:pimeloyl-ACP methyl ester carboxylesterase
MMSHTVVDSFQPLTLSVSFGHLSAVKSAQNAPIKLVALHGWLDNLGSVLPILTELPTISSLTFDWRGHGFSDWATSSHYVFSDYLNDLQEVLSQETDQPVWLLGHSLGALTATAYAAIYPEKIAGLILIEGLSPLYEEAENVVSRLRQHINGEAISKNIGRQCFDNEDQAILWRSRINQTTLAQISPIVKRGLMQKDGRWQWRFDPKLWLSSSGRFTHTQAQYLCEQVRCPVLSLVGNKGFPTLRDPLGELSWFQCIEQVVLSGRHHCHLQNVTQSAALILNFLAVHDRT